MPSSKTFFEWIKSSHEIRSRYEVALELRVHAYMEDTIAIADDSQHDTYRDKGGNIRMNFERIARAKLRIDARMWYATKISPKKYGRRAQIEGNLYIRLTPAEIDLRVAALLRKATNDTDAAGAALS